MRQRILAMTAICLMIAAPAGAMMIMSWTHEAPGEVSTFEIYRRVQSQQAFQKIASVGNAVMQAQDTTGTPGIDYCYKVSAIGGGIESTTTPESSQSTPAPTP